MTRKYGPKPGSVRKMCQCGALIQLSQILCGSCWKILPPPLRTAWLAARDGDCDAGPALDAAGQAIRDYLRGAR